MLKKISHYRLVETLGKGGMGEVYRAEDTSLKRSVALKLLNPEHSADPRRLERFQREAEAVARLNHPNIVAIYSIDQEDGLRFITMELVKGASLAQLIPENGMPIQQILELGVPLASAISAAHELGIIHRDLKPANIMLSENGQLKVLDFGLAKLLIEPEESDLSQLSTEEMTRTGLVLGTAPYMSPEQIQGKPVDHRSDIFSLGVVLYEASTGKRPFLGESSAEVASSILRDHPRPAGELRPDLPSRLVRIIDKCVEKDVRRRFQSAHEVHDLFQELERDLRSESTSTASVTLHAVPKARSNRVLVIPFENRTQDSRLDSVGMMAADWLTQGLSQTGRLEIVPTGMIFTSSRLGEADRPVLDGAVTIRALAAETGAGIVVSGGYYRTRGRLLVQCQITDTLNGTLLAAIDPVEATAREPVEAIEKLRQRVTAEIAAHLDPQLAPLGNLVSHPPSYEAYELYVGGMELYYKLDFREAAAALKKAAALDSGNHMPLLMAGACHFNLGELAKAESIVTELTPRRDQMAPLDRHLLDYVRAEIRGKHHDALGVARKATELAPQSHWPYNLAVEALKCNRPHEARAVLETLDPERGFWRDWEPYWTFLTSAHHLLGDFDGELREARRSRRLHSESMMALCNEVRALAAMGRADDLAALIDDSTTMAFEFLDTPATVMALAARELRAHGWTSASRAVAERALEWTEIHGDESTLEGRENLAKALMQAERFDRARAAFEDLAAECPDSIDYRGALGVLAARCGDVARAREASRWLSEQSRPFLFGKNLYWRAAISAWAGEKEEALDRLREAIHRGHPFEWPQIHPHADPMLEPLADHPPFLELIKPRG